MMTARFPPRLKFPSTCMHRRHMRDPTSNHPTTMVEEVCAGILDVRMPVVPCPWLPPVVSARDFVFWNHHCTLTARTPLILSPFPALVTKQKYMVFGKNGWIGGKLIAMLREQGKTVVLAQTRLENRKAFFAELDKIKPTHVLDAAGVTGRPNIDRCETHQVDTIRTNVIGTLNLAEACHLKGIHLTLYATGCISEYDEEHPIGGSTFTEEDTPNFLGSFYSKTKAYMEDVMKSQKNVCILRVRMPISDDLNPRNFVTKIVGYDKVVNIPNSMTVLTDLLPISLIMSERKLGR